MKPDYNHTQTKKNKERRLDTCTGRDDLHQQPVKKCENIRTFRSRHSLISITWWLKPFLSLRILCPSAASGQLGFPRESADKLLPHQQLAGRLVHRAQGHRSSHHGPSARSRSPQTEGFSRADTLKGKRSSTVNSICKVKPR